MSDQFGNVPLSIKCLHNKPLWQRCEECEAMNAPTDEPISAMNKKLVAALRELISVECEWNTRLPEHMREAAVKKAWSDARALVALSKGQS